MKTIVAFDFDGTLTKKDSFFEFIKFAKGKLFFLTNFIYFICIWWLFKIHVLKRNYAKQIIFSRCFKDMSLKQFNELGDAYLNRLEAMIRDGVTNKIAFYLKQDFIVVIVSASIGNWITPWANKYGIKQVIATIPEVNQSGYLTGKFVGENCVNEEKVNRILKVFPDRETYKLIAFGDSSRDNELIEFSDESHWNYFK